MTLPAADRDTLRHTLRDVARRAIQHGLAHGRAPLIDPADYPPALRVPAATFVTLQIHGELRGCIGTLEAHRPLVVDVAANAFAAAFRDTRFPPLSAPEAPALDIHLSILSAPVPMPVRDRDALLAALRPGIDGLVLEDGHHRATFLPSVWAQLPSPEAFVSHLMRKAGLPPRHWSPSMRVLRYEVEEF